ncbi:MAG: transposase [Gaiellaceae bacterium]
MTRRPRGEVAAGTYHVTNRGAGPMPIFRDDDDRTLFCSLLIRRLVRARWSCRAFCLMTTHYHLLLDVPEDTLSRGMQALNGHYAVAFNQRHGRAGHLFGARYHLESVNSDGHMLSVFRYIARNPVEARLCERPSDWLWGSYRDCIGLSNEFPFVDSSHFLGYFSSDRATAIALIREFVGDSDDVAR